MSDTGTVDISSIPLACAPPLQCSALSKQSGKRCTFLAADDSEFCHRHNPKRKEERRRHGALGGRRILEPREIMSKKQIMACVKKEIDRLRKQGNSDAVLKAITRCFMSAAYILGICEPPKVALPPPRVSTPRKPGKKTAKPSEPDTLEQPEDVEEPGAVSVIFGTEPVEDLPPEEKFFHEVLDTGARNLNKRKTPEGKKSPHPEHRHHDPKRRGSGRGL